MNAQQFAALKVGDKIVNPAYGSKGEVVATAKGGVRVRWSASAIDFAYPIHSTAWMHWSMADDENKPDQV